MRLTKKQKKAINQYIIDCIDSEPYGIEAKTDKEKLTFLYDTFKSEKAYELKRNLNTTDALKNWFQGLPSCFNLVFTNYDILQLAKTWGSLPENPTEKQEDKILDNYWNFMAVRTLQLINKNKGV